MSELGGEGPANAEERASTCSKACLFFERKYKQTADIGDLQMAVRYGREAAEGSGRASALYRSGRVNNLAKQLWTRYRLLGDIEDLREAAVCWEELMETMPQDHPEWSRLVLNVVNFLRVVYKESKDVRDFRKMVEFSKRRVEMTPRLHPGREVALVELCHLLIDDYMQIGDLKAVGEAIKYAREVLELMPPGHPNRAGALRDLGSYLTREYEDTGDLETLDQAIHYNEEAVALNDPTVNRANHLSMISLSLGLRYERKGDLDDLRRAILYAKEGITEALSAVPKDHTDRASFLVNLGVTRAEALGGPDEDSVQLFIEAWECYHSAPLARINGARYAAGILAQAGKWEESSQILEDAIRMLPKVSTRSLEGQDKQQLLLKISGLPTTAACVALQAGRSAYHALGLLELSRGIIIGSTIDYRGDISDLKGRHPEKFQKLEELRIEIDTPLPDSYESHTAGSRSFQTEEAYLQARSRAFKRREEALQEMEEILKEIRKLPGCERFQLVPSEEELKSWAKDGPVVTFVSSSYRSDAIILTSSSITALPLPDLNYGDMKDRLDRSPAAEMREYAESNQKMREMLLWLWNVAVKPVLQHLEIVDEHGNSRVDKLPHVWWIGTGRLNMAPFHAAGDHARGSTENALSHVISSYTPTIKALSYARGKKLGIFSKAGPRLLLVSMTKTPGGAALPDAAKEVEGIMDITKGLVCKHLEHPSAEDVLQQFGAFEVMHFACHGVSNAYDPSESHLMLQRDSSSTAADRLTVAAVSRKKARAAQIAYLSACSTANNAAAQLADEIIHIASGFQLAGFNHVLATMWAAESVVCTEVAVAFYRVLFGGRGGGEEEEEEEEEGGHLKVSRAMREAVLEARERDPLLPRKWAPFVHLGA
ncbi:CHAT domain-containing protein [Morchella snyderi]|nr:CHAT domain-containing protein [Morchella snyderi]